MDETKRQQDFDALVKGVVNKVTPGAVIVFKVEDGVMMSQIVAHGLPLGSIAHLIMEAYVAGAEALSKRMNEENMALKEDLNRLERLAKQQGAGLLAVAIGTHMLRLGKDVAPTALTPDDVMRICDSVMKKIESGEL